LTTKVITDYHQNWEKYDKHLAPPEIFFTPPAELGWLRPFNQIVSKSLKLIFNLLTV